MPPSDCSLRSTALTWTFPRGGARRAGHPPTFRTSTELGLLDTNVVSELLRPGVAPLVKAFLRSLPQEQLFTAAICEAELRYGVQRMPPGRRRNDLSARLEALLTSTFEEQILVFDSRCAALYGTIRAHREAKGSPIEVEDAMIAATASAYGAALVTRNVRHFNDCGIAVVDPWQA